MSVQRKWRQATKQAKYIVVSASKVAAHNKIGSEPTGWFAEVAMALQRHVAAESRASIGKTPESQGSETPESATFEAPGREFFVRVRAATGFPPARYYAGLGLQEGRSQTSLRVIGASDAAGKSGAFFFLSPDQQLIAKTCTKEDWVLLQRILPAYADHMEAARERRRKRRESGAAEGMMGVRGFADTLLPRYLALYRFSVGSPAEEISMVIMSNVFAGSQTIHRRYDLKGSTHGRRANDKERGKSTPVFKDLDWTDGESPLAIEKAARDLLLSSLEEDVRFLIGQKLIDYSLLIGIHDGVLHSAQEVQTESVKLSAAYEGNNVVTVTDGERVLYLGIVDVLTPYSVRKRAETVMLGWAFCGRDISCQPPSRYGRRFLGFISSAVFEETSTAAE
jgi:1-phosphatidylinositol-4-phosphate 5-kinase